MDGGYGGWYGQGGRGVGRVTVVCSGLIVYYCLVVAWCGTVWYIVATCMRRGISEECEGGEEGKDGKEGTGRVEGGYVECWVMVSIGWFVGWYARVLRMRVWSVCVFGVDLQRRQRGRGKREGGGKREEGRGKREEGAQGVEGEHRGYLRHADRAC